MIPWLGLRDQKVGNSACPLVDQASGELASGGGGPLDGLGCAARGLQAFELLGSEAALELVVEPNVQLFNVAEQTGSF